MMKYFRPLPDITAYELAGIFAMVSGPASPAKGVYFPEAAWETIPESVKRHFSDEGPHAADPDFD